MTYRMIDRPDGQVEIVINRPVLIGVLADREIASRFIAFLALDEPGLVEDAEAEAMGSVTPAHITDAVIAVGPAKAVAKTCLDQAFARIEAGEKIAAVAADCGMTMSVLRGKWAHHNRGRGGDAAADTVACTDCGRRFVPSAENPETCARCSRG